MKIYAALFAICLVAGLIFGVGYYRKGEVLAWVSGNGVSNFKVTPMGTTSAVVTFNTEKPAFARIRYGTLADQGIVVDSTDQTTDHKFTLMGLLPGKDHFITVLLQNDAGSFYDVATTTVPSK